MSRTKKIVEEELVEDPTFVCPVCGKEFRDPDDDCYAWIGESLSCSWKCFMQSVRAKEKQKKVAAVAKMRPEDLEI